MAGATGNHQLVRRGTEWMVATMTMLWGVALLLPGDAYATSKTFSFIALIASENTLGTIMLVLGIARLIGLIVNGARGDITPWVRLVSAGCGFLIFVGLSAAFALSGVVSTWIAIYPVIAAAELLNIYRAAHDAGENLGTP